MFAWQRKAIGWSVVLMVLCASTAVAQYESRGSTSVDDPLNYCKVSILKQVSIPAQEAGVLEELNVKEGDEVEIGSVLGVIDKSDAELMVVMATQEYQAAKKEAENDLSIRAAKMSFKVMQAEWEASVLANNRTKGTVPGVEVRRKKSQADRAEMQIELAEVELSIAYWTAKAKESQLKRAEASLRKRQIKAPINGVVVKLNKHAGDWVQPGETVMQIVQLDQLRVEGDIDGTKFARHDVVGQPVEIVVQLTGGGSETIQGKIDYAGAIVESPDTNTMLYTVRATVNNRRINQDRWLLTPGLHATMRLTSGPLQFGTTNREPRQLVGQGEPPTSRPAQARR
jgi:multidrug resistance efflux pump